MEKFSERVIIRGSKHLDENLSFIISYLDNELHEDIEGGDSWFIFVRPKIGILSPSLFLFNPVKGCYIIDLFNYKNDDIKKDDRRSIIYRQKIIEYSLPKIKKYNFLNFFGFETISINSHIGNNEMDLVLEKIKKFSNSSSWKKEFNDDIKSILFPRIHNVFTGKDINYFEPSNKQRKIINLDFGQHHRVRGVAGGGKSFILAYRAAKLASEGKRVLVTCYNLSLCGFLREIIDRVPIKFNWDNITILHKDGIFRSLSVLYGISWPEGEGLDIWSEKIPSIVKYILDNYKVHKYDAILIDEGQDFNFTDYTLISRFLDNSDELMVVCDKKQNLYGKDLSWIDKRREKGLFKFYSGWEEINTSVRLPKNIAKFANIFSNEFKLDDSVDIKNITQDINLIGQESFKWLNMEENSLNDYVLKILRQLGEDVVIIVPENKLDSLGEFLRINNIESDLFSRNHQRVFSENKNIKISTIQQFKGREANNIILFIPEKDRRNNPSLIYTAITRTRRNLFVLNSNINFNKWSNCSNIDNIFNFGALFDFNYSNKIDDVSFKELGSLSDDFNENSEEEIIYDYNAVILENEKMIDDKNSESEKVDVIPLKKEGGEEDLDNNKLLKNEKTVIAELKEKELDARELEIRKREEALKQREDGLRVREEKVNKDEWNKNDNKTGDDLDVENPLNTIHSICIFGYKTGNYTEAKIKTDVLAKIKNIKDSNIEIFIGNETSKLKSLAKKVKNSIQRCVDAIVIGASPHKLSEVVSLEGLAKDFGVRVAKTRELNSSKDLSSIDKSSLSRALDELISSVNN